MTIASLFLVDLAFGWIVSERGLRNTLILLSICILLLYDMTDNLKIFSKQLNRLHKLSGITVLNRIIKFHRLFCETFINLNHINNEIVKYAYFIAVCLHLFSNVTIIVALSTYEFEYYSKLFFYMIII